MDIQVLKESSSERIAFEWGDLTWFASGGLGNSNDLTLGRCRIKPGQGNPRHYHPNCAEILVVLQGRVTHTVAGGGVAELGEGDTVTISPNVWHCAKNIGQNDAILLIAFTSADRQTVGE